jgi:concentrative nucleoside transporter, CNT family
MDTQHNFSSQTDVVRNNDPALDIAHEHHHEHLHHSAAAEKGREDEVVYSMGTTGEKSNIPDADPMDHALHDRHHPERTGKRDDIGIDYNTTEKGYGSEEHSGDDEAARGHRWKRFYRHYKIFIHLVILLVMTGSGLSRTNIQKMQY